MAKQKITLSLDPDIIREIKKQAIDENRSASDIVNELVRQYLQSKGINV